jgi:hypothetical protein
LSATDVARSSDDIADLADLPEPAPPWTVRRVATLLAPALVFLGIREFGLLVLTWMSAVAPTDIPMGRRLGSWDGEWFLALANGGYDGVPAGLVDAKGFRNGETPMAFFPGYPMLTSFVHEIGGWLGIGMLAAAITVTIVSGVFCAYGLARIGRQMNGGSRKAGLALVALFASSPMAIVLSMAYSEALFCAFAAWALVGVLERRWVLAGLCCAFAGLVRPTAAALILAVGLAVLVTVLQRRDQWRPWIGGVLAPVGLVGYLAWVGTQTGAWNGWFRLQQRGWDSGFDGGAATWEFMIRTLEDPPSAFEMATVGFIVVSLILVIICIVQHVEWPLIVYGAGVLAMDLASNGLMNSKVRLMVPAFTLLIPVAVGLAKRRTSTMVIVLSAIAVGSAWFGAYSITSWQFAI